MCFSGVFKFNSFFFPEKGDSIIRQKHHCFLRCYVLPTDWAFAAQLEERGFESHKGQQNVTYLLSACLQLFLIVSLLLFFF